MTWPWVTSAMTLCFRFDGISNQRLQWEALTSAFMFLPLSEFVIETNDAVACTPFIMFLLPRKGQHTPTDIRNTQTAVRIECTFWGVQC